jgi:hypothetical protein
MAIAVTGGSVVRVISTRLGFERCLLNGHLQTQTPRHVVEHVIMTVAQPAIPHLQRDVPIAQMIRSARETARIDGFEGRDRLVRRADLHDPTVVGEKKIAAAQHLTPLQHDADLLAAGQASPKTAATAQVKGQHQSFVGWARLLHPPGDHEHGGALDG